MDTDIRFTMSSQLTENSAGLHLEKWSRCEFWPIIFRRNGEVFYVAVSLWVFFFVQTSKKNVCVCVYSAWPSV